MAYSIRPMLVSLALLFASAAPNALADGLNLESWINSYFRCAGTIDDCNLQQNGKISYIPSSSNSSLSADLSVAESNTSYGDAFSGSSSLYIAPGVFRVKASISATNYQSDAWSGIYAVDPDSPGGLGFEFLPILARGGWTDSVILSGNGGPVDMDIFLRVTGTVTGCAVELFCRLDLQKSDQTGSAIVLRGASGATAVDSLVRLQYKALALNQAHNLGVSATLLIFSPPSLDQYIFSDSALVDFSHTVTVSGVAFSRDGAPVSGVQVSSSSLGIPYAATTVPEPDETGFAIAALFVTAIGCLRRRQSPLTVSESN